MADEVDIEPEFEDEDDFVDRLSRKPTSDVPDPTVPTGAPPVDQDVNIPPGTPQFRPGTKSKKNKEEIDKAQREQARRLKEEQAQARRILREQQQDAAREQRLAAQEAKRQSREQITAARSEAISSRIQSYSLASSLGFPGYVAGSVIDSLFIRPREDKIVQEQNQYQRDLERYNEAKRKEELENKRRREQEIRDTPITATALDDSGKPIPPGTGGIPVTPPGGTGGSGGSGGSGGTGSGGGQPPLIPPTPPTAKAPSKLGASVGNAAVIVTAGVQILQAVNGAIDKLAKNTNDLSTSIAKGDATGATKASMRTIQSIVDPLGVNIPLNVAVQSFDILLETNKALLETTRQNIGFAPKSLQADVQGDIQKLVQTIDLTRKNDPVTAELIKANTQFELAWGETRSQFIQAVGPFIVYMLNTLTKILELGNYIRELLYTVAINTPIIGRLIESILGKMPSSDDDLDDSDILKQIDRFFDPGRTKQSMRDKNRFPNP